MATLKENSWPPIARAARTVLGATRPEAVIFDIDNCIADDSHRIGLIDHSLTGDEKYASYHRLCFADKPAPGNLAVLIEEQMRVGQTVFFVTARPEAYRWLTVWWLKQLPRPGLFNEKDVSEHLLMRLNNDKRPTVEVKREALYRIRQQGFFVRRAYDDRRDVIDMYRDEGVDAVRMLIHDIPDCEQPPEADGPVQGARPVHRRPAPGHDFLEGDGGGEAAMPVGVIWPRADFFPANSFGLPENKPVLSKLVAAMNTFSERNGQYGANYTTFGASFLSLFPGDKVPEITSIEDMNRLQTLVQMHNKMMRYAANLTRGGHADSARDIIVYAAMLEEFTK